MADSTRSCLALPPGQTAPAETNRPGGDIPQVPAGTGGFKPGAGGTSTWEWWECRVKKASPRGLLDSAVSGKNLVQGPGLAGETLDWRAHCRLAPKWRKCPRFWPQVRGRTRGAGRALSGTGRPAPGRGCVRRLPGRASLWVSYCSSQLP